MTTEILKITWEPNENKMTECSECPFFRKDGCLVAESGTDPMRTKTCHFPESIEIQGVKTLYLAVDPESGKKVPIAEEIRQVETN